MHLIGRAKPENDPFGLHALSLSSGQFQFSVTLLIKQEAPEAITRRCAGVESQRSDPALPGEDLRRQLSTIFASHCALDIFDDGRDQAAIVFELFGTVVDRDACFLADEFVEGALVAVLETSPTAYVVDQDYLEIRTSGLHIVDEGLQGIPPAQP